MRDASKWQISKNGSYWWVYPPIGNFSGTVTGFISYDHARIHVIEQTRRMQRMMVPCGRNP